MDIELAGNRSDRRPHSLRAGAPRVRPARQPIQTPLARRRRLYRIARHLAAEAGIGEATAAERVALEHCATLALRLQDIEAAVVTGAELVSNDEVIRLSGELRRAMGALQRRARREPERHQSLSDYLREGGA